MPRDIPEGYTDTLSITLDALNRTAPVQFVHIKARASEPAFFGPLDALNVLESDGEPPLEGETVGAYAERIGFRLLSFKPVPAS